jgi:antitoxin component HigA of HigAB toxin-antitoxin module
MANAIIENLNPHSEEAKFYLQEKLILEVTNHIAELMEKYKVRKSDLAQRLGKSKGYVTQLLNGNANMTLRTISDVFWALDSALEVNSVEFKVPSSSNYKIGFGVIQLEAWKQENVTISLQDLVKVDNISKPVETRQAG